MEPARRRWPFRLWETIVIAIAVVLFVLAAFAGPRTTPAPLVSPSPGVAPTAVPSPTASASAEPVPVPTGSPVATADQIIATEVGDYTLVDRGLSESGAQGGALQALELRYVLSPPASDTDVFHAIEVHATPADAEDRVRTFGAALEASGYRRSREQPLRNSEGRVQGYFIALTRQDQRLLLWSNQNATFTLGGGSDADVDAFYDLLPY